MDLLIVNTWLMTLNGSSGLGIIQDGAIGVDNGCIVYIGPTKDLYDHNADLIIDGTNKLTMPGLVNAHTHTGLTLLRGAAQDLPEIEWMNKGLGPISRHLTPDDLILGSKLGVLEGMRTGTTTFAEYAQTVGSIIREVYLPFHARVVGIETIHEVISDRAALGPTDLYEFDRELGERALKRANEVFREFSNNSLVSSMYGPQALDMISLGLLEEIQDQAMERRCRFHMHVAQGEREKIQIKGRYGETETTISILNKYGFLSDSLVAAHIHATNVAERKLMVERGVHMVGCPSAISSIDGIIPPIGHYIQLGGNAAIGSDQAPGTGHVNLFREIRMNALLSKVLYRDPTAFPPWQSLELATINGARVLGLEQQIGSLKVGKAADMITINLNELEMTPLVSYPFKNFIPNLVYSMTGHEVNDVIIEGKIILKDKKFQLVDFQGIIDQANKRAREIFAEAADDWIGAGSKMVEYLQDGKL
ncbi:MAG: amidohydrolase family protein [Candidatus Heimdallarchaeota archaeon]